MTTYDVQPQRDRLRLMPTGELESAPNLAGEDDGAPMHRCRRTLLECFVGALVVED